MLSSLRCRTPQSVCRSFWGRSSLRTELSGDPDPHALEGNEYAGPPRVTKCALLYTDRHRVPQDFEKELGATFHSTVER